MRFAPIAIALLLAGCASDAPVEEEPPTSAAPELRLPDALHFEDAGVAPVVNTPASTNAFCYSGCSFEYDFEVFGNTSVEAVLKSVQGTLSDPSGMTWVESDYDLFILDGGEVLGESIEYGDVDDKILLELEAGKYTAQVRTYQDYNGGFELDITFAAP